MKINVTDLDIRKGSPHAMCNPVALSLERSTGHKWCIGDDDLAKEIEAPFRVVLLPMNAEFQVCKYFCKGVMQPFEFEIELSPGAGEFDGTVPLVRKQESLEACTS